MPFVCLSSCVSMSATSSVARYKLMYFCSGIKEMKWACLFNSGVGVGYLASPFKETERNAIRAHLHFSLPIWNEMGGPFHNTDKEIFWFVWTFVALLG